MERVNCSEREIAKMFQIPINSLKRCRSEKRFGTDICFTAPYSHKILYDIKNFKTWFDENKLPGLFTENQYIRNQLKHLNIECNQLISQGKRLGFYPDGRRRKKWKGT